LKFSFQKIEVFEDSIFSFSELDIKFFLGENFNFPQNSSVKVAKAVG
jgi:hypothetical protein